MSLLVVVHVFVEMTLSLSALNLAPFSLCFPNKDFLVYRLTKIRGRGAVGGPMNAVGRLLRGPGFAGRHCP